MSTLRTCAALSLAAVLGTAAIVPVAYGQANCEWYARTALKQQQENEAKKCGLKGPEWSSDLKAHMTWCSGVAPDVWKAQAQKRDQALLGCAAKKS